MIRQISINCSDEVRASARLFGYFRLRNALYRVLTLVVLLVLAPHSASADIRTWPWVYDSSGYWVLNDQSITIEPNTEVCVVPPTTKTPSIVVPVYQGITINGQLFSETTQPQDVPRCKTVSTNTVIIHSTTSLSFVPDDDGIITYHSTPPLPPVECLCSSCSDCKNKFNDPNCDIVKLTADIIDHVGSCIITPNGVQNKKFDCQGHKIDGDDMIGTREEFGIDIYSASYGNTITNCVITDFSGGIRIWTSGNNNTLVNNVTNSNSRFGIQISLSDKNIVTGNVADSNVDGIVFYRSSNNKIYNNTATLNLSSGIHVWGDSSENYIKDNRADSNQYGIRIDYPSATENILVDNVANNNLAHGLYLIYAESNIVSDNTFCENNQYGMPHYFDIFSASLNSGDNNQCGTTNGWNDNGTAGCTHSCPEIVLQPGEIGCDINETGNTNIFITPDVDPLDGKIGASVGALAFAYGPSVSPFIDEAEGIATCVLPFTVNKQKTLYLGASVQGFLHGYHLYRSSINVTASIKNPGGDAVAVYPPLDKEETRPGIIQIVIDKKSVPYSAEPGITYTLEFSERVYARATGPGSEGTADFGGSLIPMISDRPLTEFPVADAGEDQIVSPGTIVQLDGSASSDPDGNTLGFHWKQVAGVTVPLLDSYTPMPHFNAAISGFYSFELIVNNGLLESIPDRVNVTVEEISGNTPPVADAGPDQIVERTSTEGAEVTLDGSGSYDPDANPLTYYWTWSEGSATGVNPTVMFPPGLTTVMLTVSDGEYADTDTCDITVEDTTPPTVNMIVPANNATVQDGVTLTAEAADMSGVANVFFYVREPADTNGVPIGYEDLSGILNSDTGEWEYGFDTSVLPDGYYVILAKAVDTYDNEGWSEVVNFSIRNWAVVEMLPASERNKAGRTMPVKFALRIAESVDPEMPFIYNEDLEIRIFKALNAGYLLQTSHYGVTSKDYRIDDIGELYITNFKTMKQPAEYAIEVWRINKNWMVGSFTFETVK